MSSIEIPAQLRAKKPSKIDKRLKALFYGEAGCGKTRCAMQFPKPYFIDTERGAEHDQYVDALERVGGVVYQTNSFDDLYNEIKLLASVEHDYRTLVIDPISTIYNSLVESYGKKFETEGTKLGFNPHNRKANEKMKHLMNLLLQLDMNVIVTAHAKTKFQATEGAPQEQTFDGYTKFDHMFDLVIEIKKFGLKVIGIVKKSRIHTLTELERFDFSYEAIREKYSKEMMERKAINIKFAKTDEVEKIESLVRGLGAEGERYLQRQFERKNVKELKEFTEQEANFLISVLKKKTEAFHAN